MICMTTVAKQILKKCMKLEKGAYIAMLPIFPMRMQSLHLKVEPKIN